MRRRRRMGGRRSRPSQWVSNPDTYSNVNNTVVPGGPVLALKLVGAEGATSDPPSINRFTTQRVRGQMIWGPLTGGTAGDSYMLHAGIGVTQATAAGVLTTWNPASVVDADKPWLWKWHSLETSEVGGTGRTFDDFHTVEIDIKAKRIIRADHVLCLFISCQALVGSVSLAEFTFLRTLITHVA